MKFQPMLILALTLLLVLLLLRRLQSPLLAIRMDKKRLAEFDDLNAH